MQNHVRNFYTQLALIPACLTSQLDISINKPFEAFVHKGRTKWMKA